MNDLVKDIWRNVKKEEGCGREAESLAKDQLSLPAVLANQGGAATLSLGDISSPTKY
jgi:hypothetical protein